VRRDTFCRTGIIIIFYTFEGHRYVIVNPLISNSNGRDKARRIAEKFRMVWLYSIDTYNAENNRHSFLHAYSFHIIHHSAKKIKDDIYNCKTLREFRLRNSNFLDCIATMWFLTPHLSSRKVQVNYAPPNANWAHLLRISSADD